MGLLDFDVNKVAQNPAFQLGLGILGSNTGNYGEGGPAYAGGLQYMSRQQALNNENLRRQQEQKLKEEMFKQQQAQYQQQQKAYQQQQAKQQANKQWMQANNPKLVGAPSFVQQAAIKSQYPGAATYGTTPYFDKVGNAWQTSSAGGARKLNVPLQKPAQMLNLGNQYLPVNPINAQPIRQGYDIEPKVTETPGFRSKVKTAEMQAKSRVESESELSDLEASLPRLEQVVNELGELGKKATYTEFGQAIDSTKRQLGMEVGEGGIARKEYISKVDNEILPLLRQTFGAAFTQKEGDTLKATLGDPNVSPAEKNAVLRSFIQTKRAQIETQRRKLNMPPTEAPNTTSGEFEELWGR